MAKGTVFHCCFAACADWWAANAGRNARVKAAATSTPARCLWNEFAFSIGKKRSFSPFILHTLRPSQPRPLEKTRRAEPLRSPRASEYFLPGDVGKKRTAPALMK